MSCGACSVPPYLTEKTYNRKQVSYYYQTNPAACMPALALSLLSVACEIENLASRHITLAGIVETTPNVIFVRRLRH